MFAVAAAQSSPAADFRGKDGALQDCDEEGDDTHVAGGEGRGVAQSGAIDPNLPLLGDDVRSSDSA
jgi:hypothetical protein